MSLAKDEKRTRLSAFLAQLPPKTSLKFAEASGLFDVLKVLSGTSIAGSAAVAVDRSTLAEVWASLCELEPAETAALIRTWTESAVGLAATDSETSLWAMARSIDRERLSSHLKAKGLDPGVVRWGAAGIRLAPILRALSSTSSRGEPEWAQRAADTLADEAVDTDDATLLLMAFAISTGRPQDALQVASCLVKPRDSSRLDRTPYLGLIEALVGRAVASGGGSINKNDFPLMAEIGRNRLLAMKAVQQALVGRTMESWSDRIAWAGVHRGEEFRPACDRAVEACVAALSAVTTGGKGSVAIVETGLKAARFVCAAEEFSGHFGIEHERGVAAGRMAHLLSDPETIEERVSQIRDPDGFARENIVRELEMRAAHLRALGLETEGLRLARRTAIAAGRPDYCSAVFAPLEPLIFDGDPAQTPTGSLSREQILNLWAWASDKSVSAAIAENEPAYDEALRTKNTPRAYALSEAVRRDIGARLIARLRGDDGPPADLRPTVEFVAPLLASWDEIDAELKNWPEKVRDFDDEKVAAVRNLHDSLSRDPAYVAASLLLLVMRRLAKPWQIFRAVQRIVRQNTDLVVEGTELSLVGDALLEDAERATVAFAQSDDLPFEGDKVLRSLQLFAGIATGVPEEFGIRREGALGRKLYELRSRGSKLLEQICMRSVSVVEAATPKEQRNKHGGRPAVNTPPDEARVAEAVAYAFFLSESKLLDQRAAFGAERVKARHAVEDRLAAHADALLEIAQSHASEDAEKAQAHLRATARIIEAFDGPAAAEILLRRAAAAA